MMQPHRHDRSSSRALSLLQRREGFVRVFRGGAFICAGAVSCGTLGDGALELREGEDESRAGHERSRGGHESLRQGLLRESEVPGGHLQLCLLQEKMMLPGKPCALVRLAIRGYAGHV